MYDARLSTKNDARLNKLNDLTIFHGEIEDYEEASNSRYCRFDFESATARCMLTYSMIL